MIWQVNVHGPAPNLPPPISRATPSPTSCPASHLHASTTCFTSSPAISAYAHPLPSSSPAGASPCTRRDRRLRAVVSVSVPMI